MLTVVIPVYNQFALMEQLMQTWFDLMKTNVKFLFIDNGSAELLSDQSFFVTWQRKYRVRVLRNDQNVGVYPTFQQGYDSSDTELIFFSHSDVEMCEYGWDEKIISIYRRLEKPGVFGMFGAKGIGTPEIYRAPYDFRQLMRWDCITVESMLHGGARLINSDYERIMVLDGFSMIVVRNMVVDAMNSKFDHERYPVHHCYDLDVSLDSHFGGYHNYVIDVDCKHHGGATSTREKWAEKFNTTDLAIHRKAHQVMYNKFRNRLPVSVP